MQGGDNVTVLAAGLPNITGSNGNFARWNASSTGAFTFLHKGTCQIPEGSIHEQGILNIDASRCSPIYQNNCNTVQPPSLQLIPQIKF